MSNFSDEYKELKPFKFWCQKVLPLVYDDSLSYYELLCKVVDYLNNVIIDVNNLSKSNNELIVKFNTLKKYVDNYFNNLNVAEEIDLKLDKMAKSGELTQLLSTSNVATFVSKDVNLLPLLKVNTIGYALQCVSVINKNVVILGFSDLNNTNSGFIEIVQITPFAILSRYPESGSAEFGHINSLTYDKATSTIYLPDSNNWKSYRTFKINSLTIEEPIVVVTDENVYNFGIYNNKVIFLTENNTIKYLDGKDVICNITLPDKLANTPQDVNFFETFIAFMYSNPNTAYLYDYRGNYLHCINFGSLINNNFPLGELESIANVDGNTYIGASQLYYLDSRGTTNSERFNQLFTFNLDYSQKNTELPFYNIATNTIYVDKNNKNNLQNGSSKNPFSKITDAVYFAINSNYQNLNINVASGDYDEIVDIRALGGKCIYLNGLSNVSLSNLIVFSGNVVCNNLTFTGNKVDDVKRLINSNVAYCVYGGNRSKITLLSCAFTPVENSALMWVSSSDIKIQGATTTTCNIDPNVWIGDCSVGTIAFSGGSPTVYQQTTSNVQCRNVTFTSHKTKNYSVIYRENLGVGEIDFNLSDGSEVQINTLNNVVKFSGAMSRTIVIPVFGTSTENLYIGLLTVKIANGKLNVSAQKWSYIKNEWTHVVYSSNNEAVAGNVYLTSIITIE